MSNGTDRRAMLAKVHIARKDLGLDEQTYRALVGRVSAGATTSAGRLDLEQLGDLVAEFRRQGWRPTPLPAAAATDPMAGKVRALWIALAEAAVVRDRSEQALRSYVLRMTRRSDLRFCSTAEKRRLIESLKQWADRAGVDLQ